MKNAVSLILLYASFGFAQNIEPITSFNSGDYMGSGSMLGDDGSEGEYYSIINLNKNGWTQYVILENMLYIYEADLYIDDYGFLSVSATDQSNPHNNMDFQGGGYCGNNTCQITVELPNGSLVMQLSFKEDWSVIEMSGGTNYNDGSTNLQWHEKAYLIQ
jgi:hypothetical protein